jgi:hypothetical protein
MAMASGAGKEALKRLLGKAIFLMISMPAGLPVVDSFG